MKSLMRSSMALALLFWQPSGVCSAVEQELEVLKQEPPAERFYPPDTKFLVDDGSCGLGRIKKVEVVSRLHRASALSSSWSAFLADS